MLNKSRVSQLQFIRGTPSVSMLGPSCEPMDIFTTDHSYPLVRLEQQSLTFSHMLGCALNSIDHLLIAVVTAAICWKCVLLKFEKTAFHAFFCTIGFVLLAAEGFMVRYNRNFIFVDLDVNLKHRLHYTSLLLGGGLGIMGTVQKVVKKNKHFHTLHGQFGLAACIFFMVNFCLGAAIFWFNQTSYAIKLVHSFLGMVSFVTGLICQYLGYKTGFFRRNFTSIESYKVVTVVILILTLAGPLQKFILRILKL